MPANRLINSRSLICTLNSLAVFGSAEITKCIFQYWGVVFRQTYILFDRCPVTKKRRQVALLRWWHRMDEIWGRWSPLWNKSRGWILWSGARNVEQDESDGYGYLPEKQHLHKCRRNCQRRVLLGRIGGRDQGFFFGQWHDRSICCRDFMWRRLSVWSAIICSCEGFKFHSSQCMNLNRKKFTLQASWCTWLNFFMGLSVVTDRAYIRMSLQVYCSVSSFV